ncbi:hypothetical protein XENOCAPTIV_029537 [Xenoophorus captivus]|uniref:DNA polymerase subunit gamma-2, mitochondrial n=1 Tax=Xenoophorus captivus TaxID=1517983 RepID=A0ABV0QGD4_9TELE
MKSIRVARGLCSKAPNDGLDRVRTLLQLCADRYFISPGESNAELFRRGWSCIYGPLGLELRRNLLQQWWHSVTGSRVRVFGVNTPSSSLERGAGGARVFALSPSDFSSIEVPENELEKTQSRGVKILYNFPWGLESLETLWCRGDTDLLQTYKGVRTKWQVNLIFLFYQHVLSGILFHSDVYDSYLV